MSYSSGKVDKDLLVKMLNLGIGYQAIARYFNTTFRAIQYHCEQLCITKSEPSAEIFIEAMNLGLGFRDLQIIFGGTPAYIKRRVRDLAYGVKNISERPNLIFDNVWYNEVKINSPKSAFLLAKIRPRTELAGAVFIARLLR
jgi:hypothetical protein